MNLSAMSSKDYAKAIGVGVATAIALSLIMVPAFKAGISPLPKPLGLAFAHQLLGKVPLPVGLLFHVVYVTFWSVAFVALFKRRTFINALSLAIGLWVLVLVIFFPFVGWGFFGLSVGPKLIVASLVPHILFAIFLWGLCRLAFSSDTSGRSASA
jgi:hypothetical protein